MRTELRHARRAVLGLVVGGAALLAHAPAAAGQQAACPDSQTVSVPLVTVRASATADRVTVGDQSPEASAQVTNCSGDDGVTVRRENLPPALEPGATYENVGIEVEVAGELQVICGLPGTNADSTAAATASLAELCERLRRIGTEPEP